MPGAPERTQEPRRDAPREPALAARREALRRTLGGRFRLRFHASVIVSGTFATGFLANALMLQWPVHSVWLRWPLAVLAGYAAFFLLVRLWLGHVGIRPFGRTAPGVEARGTRRSGGWIADLPVGGRGGGGAPTFGGAGGGSGGGGASGAFGSALPQAPPQSAASGLSDTGTSVGGAFADLDPGGGDGCLVVVLAAIVVALVAALVGGAIHLVWIAPDLLTDAAFAALLSAGALPGLRRASEPDWNGRVFRATLPVLAVVMAVILAAAWAFTHWFPGLRTLGEATRMLF